MKHLLKNLSLLAATSFAFLASSHAQPQTYDTTPAYSGSTTTFSAGTTLGETFSNVLAVQSMTYNFFQGNGAPSTGDNFSATFGQWDDASATFVAGTTVNYTGGVFIPGSAAWDSPTTNLVNGHGTYPTYTFQFDLSNTELWNDPNTLLSAVNGYVTSATTVYALMVTNLGGATNLALGQTNSNAFAYGQAYQGGGSGDYFRDWTFSQINVTPNVPESSTVAAIFGCALVAGLVGFRLRQRQQLSVAPISAT